MKGSEFILTKLNSLSARINSMIDSYRNNLEILLAFAKNAEMTFSLLSFEPRVDWKLKRDYFQLYKQIHSMLQKACTSLLTLDDLEEINQFLEKRIRFVESKAKELQQKVTLTPREDMQAILDHLVTNQFETSSIKNNVRLAILKYLHTHFIKITNKTAYASRLSDMNKLVNILYTTDEQNLVQAVNDQLKSMQLGFFKRSSKLHDFVKKAMRVAPSQSFTLPADKKPSK